MQDSRPWRKAVVEANTGSAADLAEAVREELADLWSDLDSARSRALNGAWSMQCDWLVTRIVCLSRLVGAAPWDQVPAPLLLDGVYAGIMTDARVPFTPPDLAEVRRLEAQRPKWGGSTARPA